MKRGFTRREWLGAAAASAGLTGCTQARLAPPSLVSIVRAPEYDQRIYATVRRLLEEQRLDVRGRTVVLKPNLVEFEPGSSHQHASPAGARGVRGFSGAGGLPRDASRKGRDTAATPWTWPMPPATSRPFRISRTCSWT